MAFIAGAFMAFFIAGAFMASFIAGAFIAFIDGAFPALFLSFLSMALYARLISKFSSAAVLPGFFLSACFFAWLHTLVAQGRMLPGQGDETRSLSMTPSSRGRRSGSAPPSRGGPR